MVLNFGGQAKVLTVVAPHTCPSCGVESGETIDVLAERASLAKGVLPEKECARCGGKLEFDETPESYFAFVGKYAATGIQPAAAQLLASLGLYTSTDTGAEKPPRIIKLVHGSVTYFRIIGVIGSMFRARPFLVGAEGEVVIDLAEVERFDPAGQKEWRRLLKTLANQVPAVTLVDVGESFLAMAGDTLTLARNVAVASVLVPYGCIECFRTSLESVPATWPMQFGALVCATCGGSTGNKLAPEAARAAAEGQHERHRGERQGDRAARRDPLAGDDRRQRRAGRRQRGRRDRRRRHDPRQVQDRPPAVAGRHGRGVPRQAGGHRRLREARRPQAGSSASSSRRATWRSSCS